MEQEDPSIIPAASIGNIDLRQISVAKPDAAKEIERLEDLMNRGEESKNEFRQLCQLLFDVGAVNEAEYLLRRNLDYYEGGDLYTRLFGSFKQNEFEAAIGAFKSQFHVLLTPHEQNDFLISTFHMDAGPPRFDTFALLAQPCEIRFGYIEQNKIEADITLLDKEGHVFDGEECMLMQFVNGVWEMDNNAVQNNTRE